MHRVLAITVFALIATACAYGNAEPSTTTANPPNTTAAITTPTLAPVTKDDSPCLAGDRPFASAGVISAFGGAAGDATQISGIRWASHPGCERVVVDLLTVDGAPAGALGPVGVDYDAAIGIVRVNLPAAVTRTAIADSLIDGALIDRAFVVRTADGDVAIDLHVAPGAAIALRSYAVEAPSRIVIDVKPDAAAPPVVGAASAANMVLLTPTSGLVETPLVVSGYSRSFEAQVVANLYDDRESGALATQTMLAADWVEMWGEFTATFIDPPRQVLDLFVGEESPRSGDLEGVWVTIDTRVPETPASPDL